ncbi:MAG: prepilin peptidase [Deltaproteobacteria bacterium]|nr:prepilin peptidase [Deltaproteobacteria bacterium]
MNPLPAQGLGALDIALLVTAAAFGAIWGSFLNVCIARIPRGMSVVSPPSHCFACGSRVRARDNIPILSYFLLRGRCRDCGAKFSARHALVEALTAALSVLVLWTFALDVPGVPLGVRVARFSVYFAFAAVLLALTFIDLDTKRLPDVITLPSVAVFFLGGFAIGEVAWLERAIGAVAGYAFVRLIADIYYYSTGREGLGLGDGKLLAVMGALLGWKALPAIVCAASCVGILVSVPVLVVQRRRRTKAAAPAPAGPQASPATSEPAPDAAVPGGQDDAAGPAQAGATPVSIRRAEVPFGPFLSASALAYLFLHRQAWAFLERVLLGG